MKKDEWFDDGHTVAPMDFGGGQTPRQNGGAPREKLSRWAAFAMVRGVLLAALVVAAVFAAGFLAFILFCDGVWLK